MNKFFKSAFLGALFASCLTQAAIATQLTPTGPAGSPGLSAAIAPPNGWALSFNPSPAQALGSSSNAQTVTLTASGGAVTIYSLGSDSQDFTVLNNGCTPNLSVAQGTSCSFDVKFTPTKSGSRYAQVLINSNADVATAVYLYGNAALTITPTFGVSGIPGSFTFGSAASFTATVTSSSSAPMTFSASGACSGSGSTLNSPITVTVTGAGRCDWTASQLADPTYSASTASGNLSISKGSQSLSFGAYTATRTFVLNSTFPAPTATSSAGSAYAPTYVASPANVCTGGATVTMVAAGLCTITASQAGDGNYYAADPKTAQVTLSNLQTPTIAFTPSAAVTYSPSGLIPLNATSNSPGAITYVSNSPSICGISGSSATIITVGTCSITANQAQSGTYAQGSANASILINKATPTVSFAPTSPVAFVQNGTFQISATSNNPEASNFTYQLATASTVCSVSLTGVVTMLTAGDCLLTANLPASTNYTFASANATVTLSSGSIVACDTSMTRESVNAKSRSLMAGQAVAYSFVASSVYGGQAQLQYVDATTTITVSPTACDFSSNISYKCKATGDVSPTVNYTSYDPRMCILTPGQTYYLNVRVGFPDASGAWTNDCPAGRSCSFWVF